MLKNTLLFQTFKVIIGFGSPNSFVRNKSEPWLPRYLVKNIHYFTDLHYILFQQVNLKDKNPGFDVYPCVILHPFVFLPLSTLKKKFVFF